MDWDYWTRIGLNFIVVVLALGIIQRNHNKILSKIDELMAGQHNTELRFKDCVTWDELAKLDRRVDEHDTRLAKIETKCEEQHKN